MRTPSIKLIFLAGLVAGTLDILGALTVYSLILHKGPVVLILQRIASAALGEVAFKGGWAMALSGLGFHYIIVYCFTTAYVSLYPYLSFLKKHRLASGLLYGLFAWLVMNRIVLPRTKLLIPPFQWSSAFIAMALVMLFIGLPVAYITDAYYKNEGLWKTTRQ
jgi:uncharacterized membrane protein YagU involved in acid resistance